MNLPRKISEEKLETSYVNFFTEQKKNISECLEIVS